MSKKKVFYLDLIERVSWTFAQGFCAFWIITGEIDGETLVGGLVAGGLSVAKALLAVRVGDPDSAATLPRPPDYTSPAEKWMREVNTPDQS